MTRQFATVAGFQAEHPNLVILLDNGDVTVTADESYEADEVRAMFGKSWRDRHSKSEHPLDSLFSGGYTTFQSWPYTRQTSAQYDNLVVEMKKRGKTKTVFIAKGANGQVSNQTV